MNISDYTAELCRNDEAERELDATHMAQAFKLIAEDIESRTNGAINLERLVRGFEDD